MKEDEAKYKKKREKKRKQTIYQTQMKKKRHLLKRLRSNENHCPKGSNMK